MLAVPAQAAFTIRTIDGMQGQGRLQGVPCRQRDHHQAQRAPPMAARRVMDQQASSYLPSHCGSVPGRLQQHVPIYEESGTDILFPLRQQ